MLGEDDRFQTATDATGVGLGGARVRGVVMVRVPTAGLFIPMQGLLSCVTQSGPRAWAKMGQEAPSFYHDELFVPRRLVDANVGPKSSKLKCINAASNETLS